MRFYSDDGSYWIDTDEAPRITNHVEPKSAMIHINGETRHTSISPDIIVTSVRDYVFRNHTVVQALRKVGECKSLKGHKRFKKELEKLEIQLRLMQI